MKIAVVANFDKEIQRNTRGGSELFAYFLVNGLCNYSEVDSIDVFATGKNYFNSPVVRFHSALPLGTRATIDSDKTLKQLFETRDDFFALFESTIAVKIYTELSQGKYDVIHNNSSSSVFNSLAPLLKVPMVTTLHTNVESPSIIIPRALGFMNSAADNYLIAISDRQASSITNHNLDLTITKTIHNGIDASEYTPSYETARDAPGFWIGRASRKHDKGLKEAVQVVNAVQMKLNVVVSVDDPVFYKATIEPHLTDAISMFSQPENVEQKNNYYRQCAFLLYPIMWEEPFPFVFLESLASGTPIVAFARGAVPEMVKDGETGFIVNPSDHDKRGNFIIKSTGVAGICEAIQKLRAMEPEYYSQMRKACREDVIKRFAIEKTIDSYLGLYKQIIKRI